VAGQLGDRINLIMGGGGVRLPAYVGALAALADMGVEVERVAGASAGSIVGSLFAAGLSLKQLRTLVLETSFATFKDLSLRGFLLEGGLYAGDRFEAWMDSNLGGVRFRELSLDLYVTAVDLIGREPVFFSRHTTPDMLVSSAVRCSMAIPWVWRPRRLGRQLLADGQLLPWMPHGIELLTRDQGSPPPRTLMLRLVSAGLREVRPGARLWPWDFARILLDTMFAALENQRVPGALWQDTILIDVGPIRTLQFALSPAEKERLYACGYDQVRRYYRKTAPGSP
jgi:NTE family protein